jgi:hypothetical protein
MAQSSHSLHHLPASINTDSIVERVRGMITFRRGTVASIAADRSASLEAAIVVVAVGIATGIGTSATIMAALAGVIVGWIGISLVVWFAADHLLGTPTSREAFMPILRTVGYAQAPAALSVVHFIWGLGPMIGTVGFIWSFLVTVFAVRHTTQFGIARSGLLAVAGFVVMNVLGLIITLTSGVNPQVW